MRTTRPAQGPQLARIAPPVAAVAGAGILLGGLAVLRRLRAADLHGQVVLITGGTRGLGFALAQEFAGQGARVVICGRDERELQVANEELLRQGAEVLAVQCDVADLDQVRRMVHAATDRFGEVDVLVNVAGVIMVGPIQSQTLQDFQDAMNIMFYGILHTTLTVLPQMLARRGGRIVNVTSIGGKTSVPHLLSYSSAKFAAVGFSEGLHAELAKEGITVTTVVPGLMRTGSFVNAIFKGKHRAEYTWFSVSDSLPFLSMSARRAARQIVRATRLGKAEVVLSLPAQALSRIHGAFPGLTQQVLGIVNRFLPAPGGVGKQRRTGKESQTLITRSFLTGLSHGAMRDFNQYPERKAESLGLSPESNGIVSTR